MMDEEIFVFVYIVGPLSWEPSVHQTPNDGPKMLERTKELLTPNESWENLHFSTSKIFCLWFSWYCENISDQSEPSKQVFML